MASRRTRKSQVVEETEQPMSLKLPAPEPDELDPRLLLLDPDNLRLLEVLPKSLEQLQPNRVGEPAVQELLHKLLREDSHADIGALVTSILNNGFLRHESLIVAPYDGRRFLVLEGNRRLTAVRSILDMDDVTPEVRGSIATLPVLKLSGHGYIADDPKASESYHRDALAFIGIRHLTGFQKWEPSSKYEFQARLIDREHWTIDQVARHFGRKRGDVLRDYRAQKLYNKYVEYCHRKELRVAPTYNAFAEVARSQGIRRWLGWSDRELDFEHDEAVETFFTYLVTKLRWQASFLDDEGIEPEGSVEKVLRELNRMLLQNNPALEEALLAGDYALAAALYERRSQGTVLARVQDCIRGLKNVSPGELSDDSQALEASLTELIRWAERTKRLIHVL